MEDLIQFFEIVPAPAGEAEGLYRAGEGDNALWFRRAELRDSERAALERELEAWEFVDKYEFCYENLVYDDESKGSGERVIPFSNLVFGGSYASNQVRGGCLLAGGAFAGVFLKLENTTSYGMAVTQSKGFGALLTDGRRIGRTSYHYSHCSTELAERRSSVYTLRRKEVAL